MKSSSRSKGVSFYAYRSAALCIALALLGAVSRTASAQGGISEADLGTCTLHDHVYSCDAAAFRKELSAATTVELETHNSDGTARNALKSLVADKLHKTIVPDNSPADMVFLLEPIDQGGQVFEASALRDLGTLRVYSTTADGHPAHLLWAETYSSDPTGHDLPWPIVAHGVVKRFEKRFAIN